MTLYHLRIHLFTYVFIYLSFYLSLRLLLVEITYDRSCNADILLPLLINDISLKSHGFALYSWF